MISSRRFLDAFTGHLDGSLGFGVGKIWIRRWELGFVVWNKWLYSGVSYLRFFVPLDLHYVFVVSLGWTPPCGPGSTGLGGLFSYFGMWN